MGNKIRVKLIEKGKQRDFLGRMGVLLGVGQIRECWESGNVYNICKKLLKDNIIKYVMNI